MPDNSTQLDLFHGITVGQLRNKNAYQEEEQKRIDELISLFSIKANQENLIGLSEISEQDIEKLKKIQDQGLQINNENLFSIISTHINNDEIDSLIKYQKNGIEASKDLISVLRQGFSDKIVSNINNLRDAENFKAAFNEFLANKGINNVKVENLLDDYKLSDIQHVFYYSNITDELLDNSNNLINLIFKSSTRNLSILKFLYNQNLKVNQNCLYEIQSIISNNIADYENFVKFLETYLNKNNKTITLNNFLYLLKCKNFQSINILTKYFPELDITDRATIAKINNLVPKMLEEKNIKLICDSLGVKSFEKYFKFNGNIDNVLTILGKRDILSKYFPELDITNEEVTKKLLKLNFKMLEEKNIKLICNYIDGEPSFEIYCQYNDRIEIIDSYEILKQYIPDIDITNQDVMNRLLKLDKRMFKEKNIKLIFDYLIYDNNIEDRLRQFCDKNYGINDIDNIKLDLANLLKISFNIDIRRCNLSEINQIKYQQLKNDMELVSNHQLFQNKKINWNDLGWNVNNILQFIKLSDARSKAFYVCASNSKSTPQDISEGKHESNIRYNSEMHLYDSGPYKDKPYRLDLLTDTDKKNIARTQEQILALKEKIKNNPENVDWEKQIQIIETYITMLKDHINQLKTKIKENPDVIALEQSIELLNKSIDNIEKNARETFENKVTKATNKKQLDYVKCKSLLKKGIESSEAVDDLFNLYSDIVFNEKDETFLRLIPDNIINTTEFFDKSFDLLFPNKIYRIIPLFKYLKGNVLKYAYEKMAIKGCLKYFDGKQCNYYASMIVSDKVKILPYLKDINFKSKSDFDNFLHDIINSYGSMCLAPYYETILGIYRNFGVDSVPKYVDSFFAIDKDFWERYANKSIENLKYSTNKDVFSVYTGGSGEFSCPKEDGTRYLPNNSRQKFILSAKVLDSENMNFCLSTNHKVKWHKDLPKYNNILGGGFLERNDSLGKIIVFGRSGDFGHINSKFYPIIVDILEKEFPGYEIVFGNPNYMPY